MSPIRKRPEPPVLTPSAPRIISNAVTVFSFSLSVDVSLIVRMSQSVEAPKSIPGSNVALGPSASRIPLPSRSSVSICPLPPLPSEASPTFIAYTPSLKVKPGS